MRRLRTRLTLLAALAVSLLATAGVVTQPIQAAPDEAVLGTYPTGNYLPTFTVHSAPQVIAGDYDNMQPELSATGVQGIVFDAGDGVSHVFYIQQDLRLTISQRGRGFTLSGESRAHLRSAATGAVFTWEPRVTGTVTCVLGSASRDEGAYGDCSVFHVDYVLSGNLGGPGSSGNCGSFQQAYSFAMHFEFEQMVYSPQFATTEYGAHGTGGLKVNNNQCSAAIFGVMPGDNVTIAYTCPTSPLTSNVRVGETRSAMQLGLDTITGSFNGGHVEEPTFYCSATQLYSFETRSIVLDLTPNRAGGLTVSGSSALTLTESETGEVQRADLRAAGRATCRGDSCVVDVTLSGSLTDTRGRQNLGEITIYMRGQFDQEAQTWELMGSDAGHFGRVEIIH